MKHLLTGRCFCLQQKQLRVDAHLADWNLVAAQHRSGAKESQATLYFAGFTHHQHGIYGIFYTSK
jgi:hypothetical protein